MPEDAVNTSTGAEKSVTERKAEIEAESRQKLELIQRDYWRVRNGKQRYIRCPFCAKGKGTLETRLMRRNYHGSPDFCCQLFAKALKAVLDRQDEIDKAAAAARRACSLMNEANKLDQARVN